MPLRFYYPTKAAPESVWAPEQAQTFESDEGFSRPFQLVQKSAGGTVYVQDKGPEIGVWSLVFRFISQVDRDQALDFWRTVKGRAKAFQFEDVEGTLSTVRWTNEFSFTRAIPEAEQGGFKTFRYHGTIRLEQEP